jgi:hypothetical protein
VQHCFLVGGPYSGLINNLQNFKTIRQGAMGYRIATYALHKMFSLQAIAIVGYQMSLEALCWLITNPHFDISCQNIPVDLTSFATYHHSSP